MKVGELTPVDDVELRSAMAQIEEETAANDPVKLRARIRELEKARPAETKVEVREVPVFSKESLKAFEDLNVKISGAIGTLEHMNEMLYDLREIADRKAEADALPRKGMSLDHDAAPFVRWPARPHRRRTSA
jgi:hypothetical protein